MPEPARLWLVRPGSPETIPGVLSLGDDRLTFKPDGDASTVVIHAHRIRAARRRPLTPILAVRYAGEPGDETLFFYFLEPPPLGEGLHPSGLISPKHGLERTASALTLRQEARIAKPRIREWVAAINGMMRRGDRPGG